MKTLSLMAWDCVGEVARDPRASASSRGNTLGWLTGHWRRGVLLRQKHRGGVFEGLPAASHSRASSTGSKGALARPRAASMREGTWRGTARKEATTHCRAAERRESRV